MSRGEQIRRSRRFDLQLGIMGRTLFVARVASLVLLFVATAADGPVPVVRLVGIGLAATYSVLPVVTWRHVVGPMLEARRLVLLDAFVAASLVWNLGFDGLALNVVLTAVALAGLFHGWRGATPSVAVVLGTYGLHVAAPAPGAVTPAALVGTPTLIVIVAALGVGLRTLLHLETTAVEEEARLSNASAAADERARLAREMHDSLAKTLQGIALSAAAIPRWFERDPSGARELARELSEAARTASVEARTLLTDLRDDALDHPIAEVLQGITGRWAARCDIVLTVEREPDAPLDDLSVGARHELLRILKECLANVEHHSGAGRVDVTLTRGASGGVRLTVRDDGDGFRLPARTEDLAADGHYGLIGMGERARRLGGSLTVTSGVGHGTTIVAEVPPPADDAGVVDLDLHRTQRSEAS